MQCNQDGYVWCSNKNRGASEARWTVVYPNNTTMLTSTGLRTISLATTGAVVCLSAGLGASALVPAAMATFGTVVAGVGTMHAPLAAGGCAAFLQASSAALLSVPAVAACVVAGGVAGAAAGDTSNEIGMIPT
ncbi:hypothetical protein HDV05_001801, partial [Chytridiales sp. JEL 0842]